MNESTSLSNKKALGAIVLTAFIDLLGVGLVIPIAAPLLLNSESPVLSPDVSASTRHIILGFLLATFPLAQFFGSPLLGTLADKYGRRRILLLSIFGTALGYMLFAIGITQHSLLLLFFSRFLDGLTGGNISVVYSAISDISEPKDRPKNFGMIGAAFGMGFVLGPFFGGQLANTALVNWFDYTTPYWAAAILSLINLLAIFAFFPETLKNPMNQKLTWFKGIENIKHAFTKVNLRTLFLVAFIQTLGFSFFTQFFQVFLIHKFNYTLPQVANVFAYVGIWIAFTQGGLIRPISKKYNSNQIIGVTLLLIGVFLSLLTIPNQAWILFLIIPGIAIAQGLTIPSMSSLVSTNANAQEQGEVFGINQSLQSLGMAIPSIIAGYLSNISYSLPILVAACLTTLAWVVFKLGFKK